MQGVTQHLLVFIVKQSHASPMCKVLLRALFPLLLLGGIFAPASAQQVTVSGNIRSSEDGSPLPSAAVMLQDKSKGILTDESGHYSIAVRDTAAVLVFSSVGMEMQTIRVGTRTIIDVLLKLASTDEVVIVGYGTQRKSDLTGAVSSVRGRDITSIPSSSPEQALQGRVSGLQVTSASGAPGSAPVVRIRGVGTLNNSSPIFVVDGVILDDITFLSSSDIESMEVLKDASATAIYGSRGANGVVLITTKRGTNSASGKPALNITADYNVQHLTRKIDLLNGQEFAQVVNEINPGTFNNISKVANTDWQNLVFRKSAPIFSANASLSGASERNSYYFGANYFKQEGIIPQSSYQRVSLKVNNTYEVSQGITVGMNATISPDSKNNEAGVVSTAYRAWPTSVPYQADGTSFAEVLGAGNPIAAMAYNNSRMERMRAVGNIYTDIKILDDFTFRSSYGYDLANTKEKSFTPEYFVSSSQSNPKSSLNTQMAQYKTWLWENTLQYDKTAGKHHFNGLAGYTAQKNRSEYLGASIRDLIGVDPGLWYISTGDYNFLNANNGGETTTLASYLGRVNYGFNNRYLLTASIRRDGSSKFSKNNRWGVFPSVALGWNIANEPFMAKQTTFSTLKLRSSWGIIGNEKIPWSRQYSLIANSQNAVFGSAENLAQGASFGIAGNPNLKWESTRQTDIGLEMSLLNGRLQAEFDFYRRVTNDILVDLLSPGHLGNGAYATGTYNAAQVLNRGLEANISWTDDIGNWHYRVGIVASTIHNEVLKLGADSGSGSFIPSGSLGNGQLVTRTVVGQSVGSFYGYKVLGVFQNAAELAGSAKIAGQGVGDLKYEDLNVDGMIDDKDRTFLGSYIPTAIFGLNAEVSYKQFDLALSFNAQVGNKIYNGKMAVRPDLYNFEGRVRDRWRGEGTSNSQPRATAGGANYEPSEYFLENGSFLRLRSMTFGYNLPTSKLTKQQISLAKVYLRGTNVFTRSAYTGYTPEIGSNDVLASGIDTGVYPLTAIYSVGINLSF